MKPLAGLLLALVAGLAAAQAPEPPRIVAIAFEGNETTQAKVMLREMPIRVGDPADPQVLEASRQALLDLGLFKRVELRQEPVPGGVRLVCRVRERYYVLPTPRLDANSDGQYSYGAQLRWSNVWGLNHSLRLFWEEEDRQRQGIGKETTWSAGYLAPFIADSPYTLGGGAGYTTRPVLGLAGFYEEAFRSAALSASRTWSQGAASQGWTLGGGLLWQQQRTTGAFAPAAYGEALAPRVFGGYRDLHYRIYSESGQAWGLNYEIAADGRGSDYDYSRLGAGYVRYLPVGQAPHQTLHLITDAGLYFDGPEGLRQYGLGGASRLRGYDSQFVEGNAYWYASAEFARPLFWPWLRGVVLLEAGSVSAGPESLDGEVHGSLGVGLRLRFTNFVNFELEAGFALPLDGGDPRFFASRV